MKINLRGKNGYGLGIQVFRLDSSEELTELEETEVADSEKSSTAIMRIYEDIGENFWDGGGITTKSFAKDLDDLGDIKRLNIHINSLGGDAFTAQAIHSIIADHPAKTTSYIDGVAASAATLIACAADKVIARHNTNYMVHYPWAVAIGNAAEMRKAADDLDKLTVPIVSVYKEQVKGKIDEDTLRELLADETWLTAEEALEYGFVDEVRGKIRAIAKASSTQIFCSGRLIDITKYNYKNIPDYPKKLARVSGATGGVPSVPPPAPVPKPKIENKPMTLEELQRDHPELYASICISERDRLASLDAMARPGVTGLDAIIAKAKADGKYPNDIALECFNLTSTNLQQNQDLQRLRTDAAPATRIPAGDAPNPPPPESKAEKAARLMKEAQIKASARRGRPVVMNGNGSN